ncbi:cytochrome P450 [Podospora appendiculata]|uniref:Cytochrome P450 n=1 Tax=Podospora appendiculata TaxID=314037 RepID=A0AAE0X866_9PEZI|nr:cytochrome P450 [Podospora appendiculata]
MFFWTPPWTAYIVGGVFVALYFAYRAALPKPLPGIPYNKDAASRLFGDVPEMMSYVMRTKRIFCWLAAQTTRHQNAIVQVFIKPMSLPWVVHIQFQSADARFKNNRNLINHLMAPTFISQVSAPELYNSVSTLIKLWQVKSDVAQGRCFSAHGDITYGALDAIFASSFGLPEAESITLQRLEAVSRWTTPGLPPDATRPVPFPDSEIPPIFQAVLTLANSMKRATAIKDKFISDKVNEAVQRIKTGDTAARSALHSVLLREKDVAEKEGRAPAYHKRAIADEFLGFMLAGHDTSATAVAWGVKYLADSPGAQDRLRAALRSAMPHAARDSRAPTYHELVHAQIPYLDAVIDEVLRLANTHRDTNVLGCRIPRGTDVFLMANGAGRQRSGKALSGTWDDDGIGLFRPERWLVIDPVTGKETYNPMAGPTLAFGLGPRGCFGRRLALMALRIQFAMIVWHFHLRKTPEEVSGYEAVQRFAREPTQCFVCLEAVTS